MKLLLCTLLMLQAVPDSLTLEQAWQLALDRFPVRQQIRLQQDASELRTHNLSSQFLPGLSVNGAATYQSEVPEIPFSAPGASAPKVASDQYRLSADIQQLIYDGGQIARRKAIERTSAAMAVQEVEIESLSLVERVNGAFFSALLLQNQLGILSVLEDDLSAKLDVLTAQVEAGVVLAGGARSLEAELVKISQDRLDMEWKRRSALTSLDILTGMHLADSVLLVLPDVDPKGDLSQKKRPEYRQFALARDRLQHQSELTGRRKRPRLTAFAQGALGRPPGMNIFENDILPYYQLGASLSWRFWDWSQTQRERDVLAIERSIIETEQAAFDDRLAIAVSQHRADIERLSELLARDDEIIDLRAAVVEEAASQLRNGVITATDYLIERNAKHRAELSREAHAIALQEAHVRLKTTLGEISW